MKASLPKQRRTSPKQHNPPSPGKTGVDHLSREGPPSLNWSHHPAFRPSIAPFSAPKAQKLKKNRLNWYQHKIPEFLSN